jgi:hypothetical protein
MFQTEYSGELMLQGYQVDELMRMYGFKHLDLLHCDTQGA